MIIKEFVNRYLGVVSYIVADKREAVIIDPIRDIREYLKFLDENSLKLKYIINTHPHADFVVGNLELKEIFDADVVMFKDTLLEYDFLKVKDGDILKFGSKELKIIETPGHTPYCISLLVEDYLFSGDFLFIGDMGRSDLLGDEFFNELLEKSFKSAKKIANLGDEIIILPAHIGGSLCGKSLSNIFFSSIGIEKRKNRVFKYFNNKQKYIKSLQEQVEKPLFFEKLSLINLKGATLLKNLSVKHVSFNDIDEYDYYDYIIDFRHPNCFKNNYIKGSINIYEGANYVMILGSLVDVNAKIVLAGSKNTNFKEILNNLRVIGFDRVDILKDDVNELKLEPFVNEAEDILDLEKVSLSEVRNLTKPYKVVCKSGYKAMAVESYLKKVLND